MNEIVYMRDLLFSLVTNIFYIRKVLSAVFYPERTPESQDSRQSSCLMLFILCSPILLMSSTYFVLCIAA